MAQLCESVWSLVLPGADPADHSLLPETAAAEDGSPIAGAVAKRGQ